jgi:hypothetical protein
MNLFKFYSEGNFLKVVYGDQGTGTESEYGWNESYFLKSTITSVHADYSNGLLYIILQGMERRIPFQAVDTNTHPTITDLQTFKDLIIGLLNQ